MVEEKTNIGRISIAKGVAKGSSFFLARDLYSIGRSENNTLFIPDEGISRNHCRIIRKVNAYYLVDSGSTNGTFLNGEKVEPNKHYEIRPNSEISIGETVIHFDIEDTEYDLSKRPRETTSAPFTEGGFDTEGTRELPPAALEALTKKDEVTLPFSIRSSRNLSAIYKIFSALAAVADRKYVIDRSVSLITDALEADRGFLFLAENLEGRDMKPTAWAAKQKLNMDDISKLNIKRKVINRVLSEGNSVLSPGSLSGPGVYGAKKSAGKKSTSVMSAPIQIKDKIHGILYLDTESKDKYFNRNDIELLTAIGIQLGTVMENMELFSRYQNQFIGVIKILVNVIETKDEYAFGHSSRVTQIGLAIAEELGMDRKDEETLHIAGLMHDIGKVAIPEEVLNKPDKLTEKEWDIIKKHPGMGCYLVKHLEAFEKIIEGVLHHHERFDGTGYPKGLKGNDIPLFSRIIAVADTFEAMTSDRAYRKSFSHEKTIGELLSCRGSQFDGAIVDAFISTYEKGNIELEREDRISVTGPTKVT